ncbi:hypothetical protein ABK040_002479 [Willaertia magna]
MSVQEATVALQSLIKRLGKEMIRDRMKRGIENNEPLDIHSVGLALDFFKREEELYRQRKECWLTVRLVNDLHLVIIKLIKNNVIEKEKLITICIKVGIPSVVLDRILPLSLKRNCTSTGSNDNKNKDMVDYNRFIMFCLTLSSCSLFEVIENALKLFSSNDIVSTDEFLYCLTFLEECESDVENIREDLVRNLKYFRDELKELCKVESFVTTDMITESISYQSLMQEKP